MIEVPMYGARYLDPGETVRFVSPPTDHYHYTAYHGVHEIDVEEGDSVYWLSSGDSPTAFGPFGTEAEPEWAHLRPGPVAIRSACFAVVVRGFKPEPRSARIATKKPVLPYVNGCSTSEVFPPPRLGDPTLQRLLIPAHSREQAHHIHSTVRVVYVLRGFGVSVVGMEDKEYKTALVPGMTVILDPMSPHHFETPRDEAIEVIPFHVWSSTAGEGNHAMRRGTHLTNVVE